MTIGYKKNTSDDIFYPSITRSQTLPVSVCEDENQLSDSKIKSCLSSEVLCPFPSTMPLVPVIGLPGTGKTHTLVCLIVILTLLHKRVLVCAHTHSAVDNILHRVEMYANSLEKKKFEGENIFNNENLSSSFPFIRLGYLSHFNFNDVKACSLERVIKLGNTIQEVSSTNLDSKAQSRLKRLCQIINPIILKFIVSCSSSLPGNTWNNSNVHTPPLPIITPSILSQLLTSIPIIGTTVLSLASSSATSYALLPNSMTFDICIIDEASQILLPFSIPVLLRSEGVVMMGDPHQLPPLLHSNKNNNKNTLPLSLLAHVLTYRPSLCVWLDTQYRMNFPIMVCVIITKYNFFIF
jgi:hypothetical protein